MSPKILLGPGRTQARLTFPYGTTTWHSQLDRCIIGLSMRSLSESRQAREKVVGSLSCENCRSLPKFRAVQEKLLEEDAIGFRNRTSDHGDSIGLFLKFQAQVFTHV